MKQRLCFLGLFLLLIFGTLEVLHMAYERVARRLPPTLEQEVEAIVARYAGGPLPSGQILFVGSSSLRRWAELQADMQPFLVLNHGFGGSELEHIQAYRSQLIDAFQPRAVVLYSGDNDLSQSSPKTSASVLEEYQRLVAGLRQLESAPLVFCLSIKPSPKRFDRWPLMQAVNRGLALWCTQQEGVSFIDVAGSVMDPRGLPDPAFYLEDGIHLNTDGYARWRERILSALQERLEP